MHVRDILKTKGGALSERPDATLGEVAARMRLDRIGAVVLSGPEGRYEGLVSERDVVGAVVDHGPSALDRPASRYRNAAAPTCAPDATLARIARTMTDARARHLPVIEGGRVVGVISVGDVVKARMEEMELEQRLLRDMASARQLAD